MQIIVPIYVQQRRGRSSTPPISARPLFFGQPSTSGAELGRVIAGLANKLRVRLSGLARKRSHDQLLSWHHPDPINDKTLKLHLDLRDSTASLRIVLVTLKRHERLLAFSPTLPELWFDIEAGESLEERATDVYQAHFRQLRKEQADYPIARHGIEGKAWVDHLAIDVVPGREPKQPTDPLRALLGGADVSDGAEQLRQVGRCLSWLDADDLTDPIGVEPDVRHLVQLLDVGDRRGVVIVGPSGSGRTARIEGAVLQRAKRRRAATHGLVWHLSPARIISGMSYLGQWQERVLAILRHAHHFDHVLYFDDFLGLYEAGKTRDSAMCVADTLRAQLDVRPVRILAEMSNEAWSILRERDRTLADRFVVMPTEALDKEKSMEILIGVRRRLEARRHCRFDLDVLPEVVSMYDRFERTAVLPGKAAAALSRLAARGQNSEISRDDAVAEFQSRSGLRPSIIDRQMTINRESVTAGIRHQVVGQDEAVDRLVDRVLIAAARMNDTTRPLGTFLLVGPTGVGKTQLAKAIADSLFDEGGLIRLDMNELSSPASAARLVGTFDAPDGLLTAAVRRRPHAVLLLDEIEKAHPAVLDVLLQVLGEARLSDARGRTVDMSGLLILMTSNLGSRESQRGRGFADADNDKVVADAHDRAVREFFRPEFFNRIDGVLSFKRLSPETMESIAWIQFGEILRRDGLQRRSVLIDIEKNAIRQTAERGYDPAMGARALKRQIERDLIRPAAEVLASSTSDQVTLLRLFLEDGQVRTKWQKVAYADRSDEAGQGTVDPMTADQLCQRAVSWTERVAAEVDDGPLSFSVDGSGMSPALLEKVTLRDSLHECQKALRAFQDSLSQPRMQRPQSTPIQMPGKPQQFNPIPRTGFRDLQAIDDIQDFLRESLVQMPARELDAERDQLADQLARLRQQLDARGTADRWLVWSHWYGEDASPYGAKRRDWYRVQRVFLEIMRGWACDHEDLVWETIDRGGATVECFSGALALATLKEFCGSWLLVRSDGSLNLADMRIEPVDEGKQLADQMNDWRNRVGREPAAPVRRILHSEGPQVDLQAGVVINEPFSVDVVVKLMAMARRNVDFLLETGEEPA